MLSRFNILATIVLAVMMVGLRGFGAGGSGSSDFDLAKKIEGNMTQARKIDLTQMRKLTKEEVLVVKGHYDKVEIVLDVFKIPYTLCTISELEQQDFSKFKAILINCYSCRPGSTDPNLKNPVLFSDKAVKMIRDFVSLGGFLFASDWALIDIIHKAFPDTIAWNGQLTGGETITINAQSGNREHPFLKDVFPASNNLEWKLDNISSPVIIKAKDKKTVQVLVESNDLKNKYRTEIVAATFDYSDRGLVMVETPSSNKKSSSASKRRRGTVLYVVSHFYQRGIGLNTADANGSMYQLIINFLVKASWGNAEPQSQAKK